MRATRFGAPRYEPAVDPKLREHGGTHLFGYIRPVLGIGEAKLSGQMCQLTRLQHEERSQIRGFDDPLLVERRGVVPATVIAVVVVTQGVAGCATHDEPVVGPLCELVVGLKKFGRLKLLTLA